MAKKPRTKPSVYQYLDFRTYIQDMVEYLRKKGKYSVRAFAAKAKFGSSNYLKMVTEGLRNLSEDSARHLAKAFHLRPQEVDFFVSLVLFTQAQEFKERDFYFQKLLQFRQFKSLRKTSADQYDFFSNWKMIVLLEALFVEDFRRRSERDQASLLGLRLDELNSMLRLLQELGLIEKQGRSYHRREPSLTTPRVVESLNIRNLHRQMILKALESVDGQEVKDRELGTVTIAMPREKFEELRKKIFDFQEHVNVEYSSRPDSDTVYQFNIQLFPILANLKDESKLKS